MIMERFVYLDILRWLDSERRKPLLLRGARQVGKTWLVSKLGKEKFSKYVMVDFEEKPGIKRLFDGDLNPDAICRELELHYNTLIEEGETLLFFDEIQACPRAIMALRYFYEKKPGLHIIAAGSLLEFAFDEISFPVGRIQSLNVYPMSFNEFLLATGNELTNERLEKANSEVSDVTHELLLGLLKDYYLIGGMPECVKVYANTNSIVQVREVQNEIADSYRLDFRKYKPKTDIHCLSKVFLTLASSTGKQLKYTGLATDFTIPTIKKAYNSLLMARVSKKVRCVSRPGLPLEIYASDKRFKNVFLDIGLMNCMMGLDYNEFMQFEELNEIYQGQLSEQFVGQELLIESGDNNYYWARDAKNSSAEVDYVTSIDGNIIPIEVKSGPSGKLKSLHLYRESFKPIISIVFNSGKPAYLKEEGILFLPLYYAGYVFKGGALDLFQK